MASSSQAMRESARLGGVFGEPAAAAALAGVRAAAESGVVGPDESMSVIVSGNGLKDTATAIASVTGPIDVEATVEAVEHELASAPP